MKRCSTILPGSQKPKYRNSKITFHFLVVFYSLKEKNIGVGNENSGHLKNTARAQRMLKETEVKISKKREMAKNHFSRADFGL